MFIPLQKQIIAILNHVQKNKNKTVSNLLSNYLKLLINLINH
jgi:hypothetical protein